MKELILDLSMIRDETLRVIEETLLIERQTLREMGEEARSDQLAVELLKLEDRLSI